MTSAKNSHCAVSKFINHEHLSKKYTRFQKIYNKRKMETVGESGLHIGL